MKLTPSSVSKRTEQTEFRNTYSSGSSIDRWSDNSDEKLYYSRRKSRKKLQELFGIEEREQEFANNISVHGWKHQRYSDISWKGTDIVLHCSRYFHLIGFT
jgi:hypothetical protein